jgi:4-aminobutyrate aminotransferase/(S)-3-amino-2-methylpropionate transaminase
MLYLIGGYKMLRNALPKIITALPGPKSKEVIERRKKAIPNGVGCSAPCVIARGEGAMFEDLDGNTFMDWVGGIGVLNIGYSQPEVIEAAKAQCEKYFHCSINVVHYPEYIALAEKLNSIVPVKGTEKKTMLINSGAEAVENAIKFARKFTKRTDVIVFTGAFHGRTNLTMAMTAKIKPYKFGLGPFAPGIYRCEFPYMYRKPEGLAEADAVNYYLEKLEMMFQEYTPAEEVAAIIFEPVQGEGGFIIPPIEYVQGVRKICDKYGIMLIADEVQSGYCRTGRMFASEYWAEAGAAPDIMTSAKSIAGGLPISSVTARAEIMDSASAGEVGGTYAGNPVACAAALKVIEIMERDNLAGRSKEIGEICVARFNKWLNKFEMVGEVRALGGMMAIEFVKDKVSKAPAKDELAAVVAECALNGLITMSTGLRGNNMRFLMPLVITNEQLEAGLNIVEAAITKLMK